MGYKPIESYGVIGDMHSVALVGMDGSIDWCCLPYFDSPSVFAALLDDGKGGHFRLTSTQKCTYRQMYLPDTNVLVTRFLSEEGVGEVVDFMPVQNTRTVGRHSSLHQIVRVARAVRGTVGFRLECFPAFDYARQAHTVVLDDRGAVFESPGFKLALVSPVPLQRTGQGFTAEFSLKPNETKSFILSHVESGDADLLNPGKCGEDELARTASFWKSWVSHCRYQGRWREMVYRSALALKLLTFAPTGAIVAAPTTSLPELIGGIRNWDYRYTWIRDAAFTIYTLLRLGYTEEAGAFMVWLQNRATEEETDGPLQIMYGIHGQHELPETTLDHLAGYCNSRPVRIGNAASKQFQLDIYGELMDSIYLYNRDATPISYDLWTYLRLLLDWVSRNWERPDNGIWEVRGGPRHFVHSKMQCWVALDRGLRLASLRGLPLDYDSLQRERSRIYETIMEKGWNPQIKSFVQYFGSEAVDASSLLLCLMRFVSSNDPRMTGTLDRILNTLVSDSLVHRYEPGKGADDGLPGREGTFSMCTFWLVEVLARAGKLDQALYTFEKMLTYANHLGLYAEEIGPRGEALGNFPQAFTHLGLVSAALNLDRILGHRSKG